MKKIIRRRIFANIVFTASLFALGPITSYGQDAGICSDHNVAGTYGYSGSGFLVVANPFGTPPVPISEVGTFVLNDDGTFTITKLLTNINGFVPPSSPVTGTYTVSSDCTITATNQFGGIFFGVFVDNRKEIRYEVIAGGPQPGRAGGVITYIAKRM
jgi:hypothetical protein